MVRLEDLTHEKIILQEKRFNSYMVRLEAWCGCCKFGRCRVSIPIWCDWKDPQNPLQMPPSRFQFLYGAIGRILNLRQHKSNPTVSIPIWCDWKCTPMYGFNTSGGFNSYMVRLEVRPYAHNAEERKVSIPIWCDWKCLILFLLQLIPLFQFLYGAIGR